MEKSLIAVLLGFFISILIMPVVVKVVKKLKSQQQVLEYVENHKSKNGTLTLGGLIFIISGAITFFILRDENSLLSKIALLVFISFGILGFLDDFIKIKLKRNLGLKAYQKIIGQVGISLIISLFVYNSGLIGSEVLIPFTNKTINLGFAIIPLVVVFFIAVTNSVNLTDGLDGLAGSVSLVFLFGFIFIVEILLKKQTDFSNITIDEYKNIMVLCGAVSGGILGFLILNWFPAKIFMGDTGSLALGGLIASLLCFTKLYLLIFIMGFVFVFTIFSSALQVICYKLTKKRVFKIAPFHHDLELHGVKETKIVYLYMLLTLLLTLSSVLLFLGV